MSDHDERPRRPGGEDVADEGGTPDTRSEPDHVAAGSEDAARGNPLDSVNAANDAQGERDDASARRGRMSTDASGSDVAELPSEHN